MPDGIPSNWTRPGHYSPPARNAWRQGTSPPHGGTAACPQPNLTPGGPPLAGVWPPTAIPDQPAQRWTYWTDVQGIAHACFPGTLTADNLDGGGGPATLPVYVGPSAPDPTQYVLWYDSSSNGLQVWDGSQWQSGGGLPAPPPTPEVWVGPTAPDPAVYTLWFNTQTQVLSYWTGSAWGPATGVVFSGPNPPPSPYDGMAWFDTNSGATFVWNGSQWIGQQGAFLPIQGGALVPIGSGTNGVGLTIVNNSTASETYGLIVSNQGTSTGVFIAANYGYAVRVQQGSLFAGNDRFVINGDGSVLMTRPDSTTTCTIEQTGVGAALAINGTVQLNTAARQSLQTLLGIPVT